VDKTRCTTRKRTGAQEAGFVGRRFAMIMAETY
jgi:hypothetical protein